MLLTCLALFAMRVKLTIFGCPADQIGKDLEEGSRPRDREKEYHEPRPQEDKVAKGDDERRPKADAPRAAEQVVHGAAQSAAQRHQLDPGRAVFLVLALLHKQLAEPARDFVIHHEPRDTKRRERQQQRVKERDRVREVACPAPHRPQHIPKHAGKKYRQRKVPRILILLRPMCCVGHNVLFLLITNYCIIWELCIGIDM